MNAKRFGAILALGMIVTAIAPASAGWWEQGPAYRFIEERDGGEVWIQRMERVEAVEAAGGSPAGFTSIGEAMAAGHFSTPTSQPVRYLGASFNPFCQAVKLRQSEVSDVWIEILERDRARGWA